MACEVALGTTFVFDGQGELPCELDDDGHEWHERSSAPLAARWREISGGREIAFARSVKAG